MNYLICGITELQGKPFCNLIVSLHGDKGEIDRVISYINEQKVTIKEVLENAG